MQLHSTTNSYIISQFTNATLKDLVSPNLIYITWKLDHVLSSYIVEVVYVGEQIILGYLAQGYQKGGMSELL